MYSPNLVCKKLPVFTDTDTGSQSLLARFFGPEVWDES